ncbi:MAG: hypothetical protein JSV04_04800, partial [Candidatus Heimdallarchaeota archaeon]
SGIWISILIMTVLITIISDENIWLKTFINDLPGLGLILALLISLQIWGLLPQPMDTNDEQVSTQGADIIEVTDETTGDIPDADLSETEASE